MPKPEAKPQVYLNQEFYLKKTRSGLQLACKNEHLAPIACLNLHHPSSRTQKKLEKSRLVVIDTHFLKAVGKKNALQCVAVDVKELAKQLHLQEAEALELLKSPHLFERLHLIACTKAFIATFEQEWKKEKDLPEKIDPLTYSDTIQRALFTAINHGMIVSEAEILDAFSQNPEKILMSWRLQDQTVQITLKTGNAFNARLNEDVTSSKPVTDLFKAVFA